MKKLLLLLFVLPLSIIAQVVTISSLDEALEMAKHQGLKYNQIQMQSQLSNYDSKIATAALMP